MNSAVRVGFILFVCSRCLWAGPDISIRFSTLELAVGARVLFTAHQLTAADISLPQSQLAKATTHDAKWDLYIDHTSVVCDKMFAFYRFTTLIFDRDTHQLWSFQVTASPEGEFVDTMADVGFQIHKGGHTSNGVIALPIFSLLNKEPVLTLDNTAIVDLALARTSTLRIEVRNRSGLAIRVRSVQTLSTDASLWRVLSSHQDMTTMTVGAGRQTALNITVVPVPAKALMRSVVSRPNQPNDHLRIQVLYATLPGGPERSVMIDVPVRFASSVALLLYFAVTGATWGSVCAVMLLRRERWRYFDAAACYVVACAASCVLELAGLVLFAQNTWVVLFGVELSPLNAGTTILLGIAVGYYAFSRTDAVALSVKSIKRFISAAWRRKLS